MGNAKYIGRVGALARTLGIGIVTRAAVAIGTAVVAATAMAPSPPAPTPSAAVRLAADSTALLVCGGACPTWNDGDVKVIMDQYIAPTHPGQTITPVAVTTPSEFWPITGLLRLIAVAVGTPLAAPGGSLWPDEPWWKLSGLFDLTANQSLQAGAADLEAAMAAHGNDHLVIYGYSLGAGTTNVVKKRLAEQYPAGTTAPDIDFVLGGDPNLPNGGLMERFPGLYIPILDATFNGAAATDTQFKTVEINRQYDGAADFPLYPLNLIADLNAGLGFLYRHGYPFDVSLPSDPTASPAYQGSHGDTSYYFFETQDLPLFDPLRQVGVPESLIDVVEPFFRVLVELGYDRSIPPWEPTPARLIPQVDPAKVAADLVNAIGEGVTNALGLVGVPSPKSPATVKPTGATAAGVDPQTTSATDLQADADDATLTKNATDKTTTQVAQTNSTKKVSASTAGPTLTSTDTSTQPSTPTGDEPNQTTSPADRLTTSTTQPTVRKTLPDTDVTSPAAKTDTHEAGTDKGTSQSNGSSSDNSSGGDAGGSTTG